MSLNDVFTNISFIYIYIIQGDSDHISQMKCDKVIERYKVGLKS